MTVYVRQLKRLMIDQKKNAIVGRQKSFEAHLLII